MTDNKWVVFQFLDSKRTWGKKAEILMIMSQLPSGGYCLPWGEVLAL
jgi:hypothetical protein